MNPFVTVCREPFRLLIFNFILAFGLVQSLQAQTPAFPGALGFGANVTGGRGGSVYHVTTLADSGTGSFRDAVAHSRRIIVFDVGGYIKLNSAISCAGDLTIAGQTAPGGGIGFRGGEISFSSRSNIICRYIRIRPGSETSSTGDDALAFADGRTMIFDHVSLEFGPWNNVDCVSSAWQTTPVTEVTFQNCLNADPTGQQFGAHTESVNSTMSWFYNVFANSHNRNPLSKINDIFINNVNYNYQAAYTCGNSGTAFSHDIINNYFITGPSTSTASDDFYQIGGNQSLYESGNLRDSNKDGNLNGSATSAGEGIALASPWSSLTATIPTYSPATAYRLAVSQAGALPRDQVDDLVMSQIKTLGTAGSLYTSQTATGLGNNGYGVINGGIAPLDSDNDGMPDYWEKAMGLNFNSASDAMTIGADGYANIERYLNWLGDPHALTVTNTPVDIDLWQYTSGFTNAAPNYSVTILSNGVVTLNSGHIAHFVHPVNFSGLGSFQFTVTGNDGTAWTNTVAVLAAPVIPPPANLVWQGDGTANVWGNGSGVNWFNGTNLVAFNSADSVTFDDTGANTPAITLTGNLPATTVYVLAQQDYTFGGSGAISGGASLFKTGSGQLTIKTANTFTGGTTINDGVVQLGDGASVNGSLTGNITNNDTLIYANPNALSSSASLAGYGAFIKNGAGALTLSGTHSFTGSVEVDAGSLQFSTTIPPCDISNNTSLIFAPSSFTLYTNVISGPGTLTSSGSGTTILSGTNIFAGGVTNTAGFLVLSNNSAAGSGVVTYIGGYVVPAAGVTITNDFYVPASSASDLCMAATNSGTATWAGNVYVGGSAQWRPGSDGGTLQFLGSAVMGNHIFIVPRGGMIFASNAVATSTVGGVLGRDGSGNKRSANITIRDNASVAMAGCSIGGGKVGGSVTITLQNSASLSFGANTVDLHNIANSAAVSTLRLNGGTLTTSGFTKTLGYTNFINFNGGVLKASAFNTAFLPPSSLQANLIQAGGAKIDDGGFLIAISAPLSHDPALGATVDGGLTKLGNGTLTLAAVDNYTGPTSINAGILSLYAPPLSAISNSASLYIASGAQFDFLNGGFGAWTLSAGKTLWGGGSVKGYFTLGSGATLAPGSNSIGTLTFSNALTLAAGSTNIFEISKSPFTNDAVVVSGVITNGGTLIVTNIAGTLAAGNSFKLFNATAYSGNFSTVQLPSLGANLAWNTNSLATNGVIAVVNTFVPSPVIGAISISGNNLGVSGTGGVANAFFILLGTTNLVPANWTPLLTNQFDGAGNFNFTNPLDPSAPQEFYRLQLP